MRDDGQEAREIKAWRTYIGTGLLIGLVAGVIEATVVNRTGLFFIFYAALAYGVLASMGFVVIALIARVFRHNLLPLGVGAAIAFFIVLEAAFWLNKKSPLPVGSTQSIIVNLVVLAVGVALGFLAARYLRMHIVSAARLRRMLGIFAGLIVILAAYFTFVYFEAGPGINCILISVDALRPDHLSCYGYHRETSPNIDRLAAEGTIWHRAFTTCPGSTAGHASMLTGLYTLSHGAYVNAVRLPEEATTAAEVFKRNGYSTAAFTRNWYISPAVGFGQGFDCFVDKGYGLILRMASPRIFMLGLALTQTILRVVEWPGRPSDLEIESALDWIRSRHRHRFFIFLHIMDTHSPYIPPAGVAGRFGDGDLSPGRIQYLHNESLRRTLTAEESRYLIDRYDEEIFSADLKIGRLVEELRHLGILDRTMIILLADHGEVMEEGESKQFGHGTLDYGSLRIPLIMRLPGKVPHRSDSLGTAQCIDVLPTVAAVLKIEDEAHRQGISLLADGIDSLTVDRPAFASGDILARDEYTLITPDWQYTVLGDRVSLHPLDDNPYHAPDVAETYPAVAESLQQVLAVWMQTSLAEAVVPFSIEGRSVRPGQEALQRLKALGYIQ